jgi:hypothetical protein
MSEAINYQEDAEAHIPTDVELGSISVLVTKLKQQNDLIRRITERLVHEQKIADRIRFVELPEAMLAAKVNLFKTEDGSIVSVTDEVYASISKANEAAAFAWLNEHGFGDLVKSSLSLSFGRGQGDACERAIEVLKDNEFTDYSLKESVHTGSLKALVREQLAAGNEIPFDVFGVHIQKEAKVK